MKSIRWGGLITLMGMIFIFAAALLFAGRIIKPFMESGFTNMNGAKVDIEAVDISYSPLTLLVEGIQIADPQQPMVNTMQIDQLKFALSFEHLLFGKLVIDEAFINGIKIDTPRDESGLIKQDKKEVTDSDTHIAMPDMNLPDIKTILATESFLSDKLIDQLNKDMSETEIRWNKTIDSLPNKEKSDAYNIRFNKIQLDSKGDATQKLVAIKESVQLSNELKIEHQHVKQAKDQFDADLNRINSELKAVKNAPKKDIARIKNKFSNLNAKNISQVVFGDQVSNYAALAKQWYGRIEPYLSDDEVEIEEVERSKGVDVVFVETKAMPDFFVGIAAITADLPSSQFAGKLTNISSDQSINKQSMRLKLKGVSLTNKESEEINAEFNYIDINNSFTQFNYSVVNASIKNLILSESSKLPLTMKQAVMNFHLYAKLQDGSLDGLAKARFKKVRFTSNKSPPKLASSFSRIKHFVINGQFSGSAEDISVKIDSNLDKQLGKRLKDKLINKNQSFGTDLKQAIDKKIKEPMSKISAKKVRLNAINSKVDDHKKQLQERLTSLKETINKNSEQNKTEIKDELKNKLKNKFGL